MGGMPGPGMGGMGGGGNQNYRSDFCVLLESGAVKMTNNLQSHGSCWSRPFIPPVEDDTL